MSAPLTFVDPIFPVDAPAFALERMKELDAAARKAAIVLVRNTSSPADLRARAAEYARKELGFLASINRDLADLIEIDPRLEVLRCMGANARVTDGTTWMFINDLSTAIRRAHRCAQKAAA